MTPVLTARELRDKLNLRRHERAEENDKLREMNARCLEEGRDLTAAEREAYERIEARVERMGTEVEDLDNQWREAVEREPRRASERRQLAQQQGPSGRSPRRDTTTLGREQRMSDWASDHPSERGSGFTTADADEFCLGNVMRALVEPDYRKHLTDVETRALAEGTDSAGGFWTPEVLSVNFIDRIRNNMKVIEAGATTVPLNSDRQSIPRLSGGVTGAWRTENSAFATTDPTFDRVTFTPQSYGFLVKTSEELYADMVPGGGQLLEREFTQAAALEIDRAALRGTGTPPEPQGIRNQSGVTIQSLATNGATPTAANLLTALSTLQTANREPNGIIYSPRSAGTFAGLVDTTGQPLRLPELLANIPKYVSAQIPNNLTKGTSSDASEIYMGYWPDLLLGIRLGVQLRLLTERYADTGQYAWRVFLRMDVQLAHPESFVVLTGVRP